MILQKKIINNVPTLVPLTADTGSGVPVGTIIGQYKKVNMSGYLYLDGSTFDQTLYPALYAYLGTNVLPDYREFVLVGAEQNTTSATIADHDVFTQGQEKDDQIQNHVHRIPTNNQNIGASELVREGESLSEPYSIRTTDIIVGRHGTTTRTKEKAVFWYIKATTGIIESEATEMLNVFEDYVDNLTDDIKMKFIHITWGPVTAGQSYTRSAADLGLSGKQLVGFAEAETGGPNAYDNHRIHIAYASNVFSFDCTITQGGCSTYGVIFYK